MNLVSIWKQNLVEVFLAVHRHADSVLKEIVRYLWPKVVSVRRAFFGMETLVSNLVSAAVLHLPGIILVWVIISLSFHMNSINITF